MREIAPSGLGSEMNSRQEFRLHTNVWVGAGAVGGVVDWFQTHRFNRIGVIADAALRANPDFVAFREHLGAGVEVVSELLNSVAEPDYDYLEVCREQFAAGTYDCLLGVGGGSTLDLTKAVSVLITNPGKAVEYRGFDLVRNPGVPVVAVPSTAGTGAEVTPNAVFTDRREMRRLGINTPLYVPKLAVLDPTITRSCPRSVTVGSGIDALMQSIESFVSTRATPHSRMFSKESFFLVFNTLPKVARDPGDLDARSRMQVGAYYSGIALMNSTSGPAGAISYPLGTHFQVPHGLAHAVCAPGIADWNIQKGCTVYAELHDLMEGADRGLRPDEKSVRFVERLRSLYADLGVSCSVKSYGVTTRDVQFVAEKAALLKVAIECNPVPMSLGDISTILADSI